MTRSWSQYIPMRDGVSLAIDVHLPELAAAGRVPTLLRQTRYLRGIEFRWPFRLFFKRWFFDTQSTARTRLLADGYAWVDVDVRGSGASGGRWDLPWSPAHIQDGHDLMAWIVAQPWSDGAVGGVGISYDGTCAELLLASRHPALKAVAPRFSLYDVYADVALPGGIALDWFVDHWQRLNRAFDDNQPHRFVRWWIPTLLAALLRRWIPWQWARWALTTPLGLLASALLFLVYRGAKPVDGDTGRQLLRQAVAGHRDNFDVYETLQQITYRDDAPRVGPGSGPRIDDFSPHAVTLAADRASVPVFSYSGWFDGGYQRAAIARHLRSANPADQLLIGPWCHGGDRELDPGLGPGSRPHKCRYDHDAELLRFFDRHLKSGASDPRKPVRYYTLGEGAWKESDRWPPPSTPRRWQLSKGRLVSSAGAAASGHDVHRPPRRSSTGDFTRWKSLLGMPVRYAGRAATDRSLLVYQSEPLEADLEVTGHPKLSLRIAVDATDAQIFAYLEDVFPTGGVSYVTEGQLRCLHRKLSPEPNASALPRHSFARADGAPMNPGQPTDLSFALLPTSYRFARGHAIRLTLAFADADNFASQPPPPTTLTLFPEGSCVELPVV